jgi:hypothetical protein
LLLLTVLKLEMKEVEVVSLLQEVEVEGDLNPFREAQEQ